MGLLNWAKNKSARMVGYERIKEDSKLIYDAGKALSGKGEPDAQEKMQKLDKATLEAKKKNYVFFKGKQLFFNNYCLYDLQNF